MIQPKTKEANFTSPFTELAQFQNHFEKLHYYLGLLDPSSKSPGLLGIRSWKALKEGLLEEKAFFEMKKDDQKLTSKQRDLIFNSLKQIEIALKKIS